MNILPDEMEGKKSAFSLQLNSSVDQYDAGVTGTASTNQDVIMHCSVPLWQFISMKLLKLILFPADEPEVFKSKGKKVREKERTSFNFNQNGLNVRCNDPQNKTSSICPHSNLPVITLRAMRIKTTRQRREKM